MSEYVIVTDDSCDLSESYMKERGIKALELKYIVDGNEYCRSTRPIEALFDDMRAGKTPSTTQVNVQEFEEIFENYLKQGKDVLYLGFSSGLSGTFNSGKTAAEEVNEKYTNNKVIAVDTLSASAGQALLIDKVYIKKEQGATIEEAAEYARYLSTRITHSVVVDDLMHLHRGGRVSKGSAIAGSIIGIKPIINVDKEGKLVTKTKIRGRKQSLVYIVDSIEEMTKGVENDTLFINHGDCLEDAQFILEEAKRRFNIKRAFIENVGPVIGCHTGPGVVVIAMVGNERED